MGDTFDVGVIGASGLGSAAACHLAQRGVKVLVLDQFEPAHPHGGSQDVSRIIRFAYHDIAYTQLLPLAYDAWRALEDASSISLLTRTGGLDLAFALGPHVRWIDLYADSMSGAEIAFEMLDSAEVRYRFPQFQFDADVRAVYQHDTSIIDAARAIVVHLSMARRLGATVLHNTKVKQIRPRGHDLVIETVNRDFVVNKLVVAAGAWADSLVEPLGASIGLTVTQEQVTYYATPFLEEYSVGRFPFFQWHDEEFFYAFPIHGEVATKIGIDAAGPIVTPETRTYEIDPVRERRVEVWLERYVPGFLGPKLLSKTCLYDMPRDRDLVLDALPDIPNVVICCGAGHGFKFAPLSGRVAADLALDGYTSVPIERFRINRPAIEDASQKSSFRI